jgi:hypothetical protein
MALTLSQGRRTITIQPDQTSIAGMSRAAALVVSWTAHGLSTGDYVSFYGITTPNNAGEWVALNGKSYPITWVSASTFSIPVNSSTFTAAYVDGNDPGKIGTDFDITRMQSGRFPVNTAVGTFVVGETATQATSGATGIVYRWDAARKFLYLVRTTGTFDATHTITGGTSGATCIPNEVGYAFPQGIRLSAVDFSPSQDGDTLIVREVNSAGPIVYPRRTDTTGGGIHKAVGGRSLRVKPYIVTAEQSWGYPAGVKIVLEFD